VAQDMPARAGSERKDEFFITWGYNRAYYNPSDLHLKGEGFDFTLFDVRAADMPEKWDPAIYLNPTKLTIPQFNFRIGYYFKSNWAFSAGWDHMKYRLITTQSVRMSGHIDPEVYFDPDYTGTFDNTYILYKPSFMDFHHSDGFNFIRLALERRLSLWTSLNGKYEVVMNGSVSGGAMMPWTDFTFFRARYRNWPHFAGYGVSISAGFRFEFFRHFFLQVNAQSGWSHLGDIMLQDSAPSRGEQNISFFERSFALGGYIPISLAKKEKAQQD
jgi:hypothetical protein